MEELVLITGDKVMCTSLQVAEKFGKRHDAVLRSIDDIINGMDSETAKLWFQKTTYKSKGNNKSYPMYEMNRDGFSIVAMGFNGKKAFEWKVKYIKAFDKMEEYIKSIQTAKMDYPALTKAIEQVHEEPKFYHFSNEINMINRIVLGMDAKHFKEENGLNKKETSIRPYLTKEQINAVEDLQRVDIGLLVANIQFEQRKQILKTHYEKNVILQ